jgi:GNAT superfamily N-acetyltransferase
VTGIIVDGGKVRPGRVDETAALTELAIRSKGYWGYDSQFLSNCREELTISPDFVESGSVFVLEERGIAVGFYSLAGQTRTRVELAHLFVEPSKIGGGKGTALFSHAVETARRAGFQKMIINSDPFAEEFYKAKGARRFGEVASPAHEGRMLPVLLFDLSV